MTANTQWNLDLGDLLRLSVVPDSESNSDDEFWPTAPTGSAFETFFDSMRAIGAVYVGSISGGSGAAFLCPLPDHKDSRPSFHVHVGSVDEHKGKPVFNCSPCSADLDPSEMFDAVIELGVSVDGRAVEDGDDIDFGPAAAYERRPGGQRREYNLRPVEPIEGYVYTDADGTPLYRARRLEDAAHAGGGKPYKEFRTEAYDPERGRYLSTLGEVQRVPWQWSRFAGWAETGKHVWFTEGEKAAQAILNDNPNNRATCFAGGVAAPFRSGWTEPLKVLPEIRLWADLDSPGIDYARARFNELTSDGIKASIWCNPPDGDSFVLKGDAAECVAADERPVPLTQKIVAEVKRMEHEQRLAKAAEKAEWQADATQTVEAALVDDKHDKAVKSAVEKLMVAREARAIVAAGEMPPIEPFVNLADLLAREPEPIAFVVEELWPRGESVLWTGPRKAGKTTGRDNLIRSLVDGVPFLDRFDVPTPAKSVAVFDFELSENIAVEWFRRKGIENAASVHIQPLKGKAAAFNLLDRGRRREWAQMLHDLDAEVLLLDCLKPVLTALGLDEHRDTSLLLNLLDELCADAGAVNWLALHHTGWATDQRSRGDSGAEGVAGVMWRTLLPGGDLSKRRQFKAEGREVYVEPFPLDFDAPTGLLSPGTASIQRTEEEIEFDQLIAHRIKVSEVLQAASEPLGINDIFNALKAKGSGVRKGRINTALLEGMVADGFAKRGPTTRATYLKGRPFVGVSLVSD